jgi:hypothetical protein
MIRTNGNGKRDDYVEPTSRWIHKASVLSPACAVMPNPWTARSQGTFRDNPGAVVRVAREQPFETAITEIYNVPMPGFGRRW